MEGWAWVAWFRFQALEWDKVERIPALSSSEFGRCIVQSCRASLSLEV